MIDSIRLDAIPRLRNMQALFRESLRATVQRMDTHAVRAIVAKVINDAVEVKATTHKKIVAAGVANGPLGKIRHEKQNFGVDTLDVLAAHFQIEPWQLICPMRPSNEAVRLGRLLDAIEDVTEREQAYALALQVLMQNPVVRRAFARLIESQATVEPLRVQ